MKEKIFIIALTALFTACARCPAVEDTAQGGLLNATPENAAMGSGLPFMGESFQTDLATGAATMSVPITTPPGRKNMQPKLALSYSSNNSNGTVGVGWALPQSLIQRSTKTGAPRYDDSDTFIFASSGANAELVEISEGGYRAKIEGSFMKYLYDATENTWTVYDKQGTKYYFGQNSASRLEEGIKTYAWYLDKVEDIYGNYITYIYDKPADGQIYLQEIQYTGGTGLSPDKKIVFNYEERPDKLYSMRSGWEIKTSLRLDNIEVKVSDNLVWKYVLNYNISSDTGRLLLGSVTVEDKYGIALPAKTFTYQTLE